jgi:hypothetical protein
MIDDARVVIYDCIMFMIQAMGDPSLAWRIGSCTISLEIFLKIIHFHLTIILYIIGYQKTEFDII